MIPRVAPSHPPVQGNTAGANYHLTLCWNVFLQSTSTAARLAAIPLCVRQSPAQTAHSPDEWFVCGRNARLSPTWDTECMWGWLPLRCRCHTRATIPEEETLPVGEAEPLQNKTKRLRKCCALPESEDSLMSRQLAQPPQITWNCNIVIKSAVIPASGRLRRRLT